MTETELIPPGTYRVQVGDVRTRKTAGGDTLWALRLVVVEGEHVGRQAAWDNLVFSARGMNRARKVLGALGIDFDSKTKGPEWPLEPSKLLHRTACVKIRQEVYQSSCKMEAETRNEVPYDGWSPLPEPGSMADIIERVVMDAEAGQSKVSADDCPKRESCRHDAGLVLILVSTLVALWDMDEIKTPAGKALVQEILRKADVDVGAKS